MLKQKLLFAITMASSAKVHVLGSNDGQPTMGSRRNKYWKLPGLMKEFEPKRFGL